MLLKVTDLVQSRARTRIQNLLCYSLELPSLRNRQPRGFRPKEEVAGDLRMTGSWQMGKVGLCFGSGVEWIFWACGMARRDNRRVPWPALSWHHSEEQKC